MERTACWKSRFGPLALALVTLCLVRCKPEDQAGPVPLPNSPTAKGPAPSSTPARASAPVVPPLAVGASWDAAKFISAASFATLKWPTHPEWDLIAAKGESLVLVPDEVGNPVVTSMRVPLPAGEYHIVAVAKFADQPKFGARLKIDAGNNKASAEAPAEPPIVDWLFGPGELRTLDKTFKISGDASELAIQFAMGDGSENNWYASLTMDKFRLERVK